jgi:hypothetical protein
MLPAHAKGMDMSITIMVGIIEFLHIINVTLTVSYLK